MRTDVLPWLEYRWDFGFPVGMFRAVVERLRGTPARLEELVDGVGPTSLRMRPDDGSWSAQEHAGHLVSVERLWQRRLDEFAAGAAVLTAADMGNRATEEAAYGDLEAEEILAAFRAARRRTVDTLDRLGLADAARVAHHPRLDRPMRLVDLCVFAAEHDDHHLAVISSLR